MSDTNKAAVTESNADVIDRLKWLHPDHWSIEDAALVIKLAEERVMIEEHNLSLTHIGMGRYSAQTDDGIYAHGDCPSTAIRAAVSKIGEGK